MLAANSPPHEGLLQTAGVVRLITEVAAEEADLPSAAGGEIIEICIERAIGPGALGRHEVDVEPTGGGESSCPPRALS